jgi:hypothetical protein
MTTIPFFDDVPSDPVRVFLGAAERRGAWRVPRHLDVRVILGSAELDLREAELAPGLTTIDVSVTLGSVEIKVPAGVAVECGMLATLGSVGETTGYFSGDPETPIIRIVGDATLGSCEIVRG